MKQDGEDQSQGLQKGPPTEAKPLEHARLNLCEIKLGI